MDQRVISPNSFKEDEEMLSLRPEYLKEYIGQANAKEMLDVYIKGIVTKITPKYIICENNGIGYLMIVSNPYNFKLNEEYKIYTHQYVR